MFGTKNTLIGCNGVYIRHTQSPFWRSHTLPLSAVPGDLINRRENPLHCLSPSPQK